MGEEIRELGLDYDLVLSQPGGAGGGDGGAGRPCRRAIDERIYDASAGELLAIVQDADDARRPADDGRPQSRLRATGLAADSASQSRCRPARWSRSSCRSTLARCWQAAAGELIRFLKPKELALVVERGREPVAKRLQPLDIDPPCPAGIGVSTICGLCDAAAGGCSDGAHRPTRSLAEAASGRPSPYSLPR